MSIPARSRHLPCSQLQGPLDQPRMFGESPRPQALGLWGETWNSRFPSPPRDQGAGQVSWAPPATPAGPNSREKGEDGAGDSPSRLAALGVPGVKGGFLEQKRHPRRSRKAGCQPRCKRQGGLGYGISRRGGFLRHCCRNAAPSCFWSHFG